jgi:hypothetical protein
MDLQEGDDIIIKPADKGSAVVVMDKMTYLQEAERQLSDCRFYEKLDSAPSRIFAKFRDTITFLDKSKNINDFLYVRFVC